MQVGSEGQSVVSDQITKLLCYYLRSSYERFLLLFIWQISTLHNCWGRGHIQDSASEEVITRNFDTWTLCLAFENHDVDEEEKEFFQIWILMINDPIGQREL